jgi:hypothetical protein
MISTRNPTANQSQFAKALGMKGRMGHTLRPETGQAGNRSPPNMGIAIPHQFHDGGNRCVEFGPKRRYNPASVCERATGRQTNAHIALREQTGSEWQPDEQCNRHPSSIPRQRESLPGSRYGTLLQSKFSLPERCGWKIECAIPCTPRPDMQSIPARRTSESPSLINSAMAGIAAWISVWNPVVTRFRFSSALRAEDRMCHTLHPETRQAVNRSPTNIGTAIPHQFRNGGNRCVDFGPKRR